MKVAKLNLMRVPVFSKETVYKSPPRKVFPSEEEEFQQPGLQIPEIKHVSFKYKKLKRKAALPLTLYR